MDGVPPKNRARRAIELACEHLPAWQGVRPKEVKATVISGGLTNALWSLHPPHPAPPIAARAFGDGSDLLVDRAAEKAALTALNPAGFGAASLVHFPGGRLEELLALRTLDADGVADPAMAARIAAGLARLHAAGRGVLVHKAKAGRGRFPSPASSSAAAHAALFRTMRSWLTVALRLEAVAAGGGGAGKGGKVSADAARAAARAAAPSPAPRPADGLVAGVPVAAFAAAIDRWEAATAPLAAASGPPVFAHMDLLPGNIMVAADDGGGGGGDDKNAGGPPKLRVRCPPANGGGGATPTSDGGPPASSTPYGPGPGMQFIDFEYARPAPRGFDVGNHWCEWAGLDCEWGRYPSPGARAAFAAAYLAEAARWDVPKKGKGAPTSAPAPPSASAIAALVVEGDAYALAAHLWWAAWALVQARVSPIDFDYGAYAASRFSEFLAREGDVRAAVDRLCGGRAKKKGAGAWLRPLLGCGAHPAVV